MTATAEFPKVAAAVSRFFWIMWERYTLCISYLLIQKQLYVDDVFTSAINVPYTEVSINGGTPLNHPFLDLDFHYFPLQKPSILWYPHIAIATPSTGPFSMANNVNVEQLRAEVRKLLVGIDLKTFTIGSWEDNLGNCKNNHG